MTNLTEEDVKFICEFLLAPLSEEVANAIESYDKASAKVLEGLFDGLIKQINEIIYEQERDRRFYKVMFSEALVRNQLFTPAGYDEFYKSWCAEFDKLNKEKMNG